MQTKLAPDPVVVNPEMQVHEDEPAALMELEGQEAHDMAPAATL